MGGGLVIFDCDGVLADSEPVAVATITEFLVERGLPVTLDFAYRRFLGRSWPSVAALIEEELGYRVTEEETAALRARLFSRIRASVRAMPGIEAVLDGLALPACVASSSLPDRLRLTLEAAGLLPRFHPHVFSAAAVPRGKPAPDLFLHAAAVMGVAPADCLVVEDSPTGIAAGRAAGMTVVAFLAGSHVVPGRLAEAVAEADPDWTVWTVEELAERILAWERGTA